MRFGVCGPGGLGGGRDDAELRAAVAYCDGRKDLGSAVVEGPALRTQDPGFADVFNSALREIMPTRNPNFDVERPRLVPR